MGSQMWAKGAAAEAARDCPRCERPAGRPCKNMKAATWKPEVDLVLPHKERLG